MPDRLRILLVTLITLSGACAAVAGPYSELIVFGDSLSDVGNIDQASFGLYPASAYYEGRFSDGPVYSELLAAGLGLPTLTHSRSGGNNFAHGAAKTFGTTGLIGLFIQDIDEQIDAFLGSRTIAPNALTVVFSGANDLLGSMPDVGAAVESLADSIDQLINSGANSLLVPNLPLLGLTPRFNSDPNGADRMNELTIEFNDRLGEELDGFELAHPQVQIFRLDVAELFSELVDSPAEYGFENATASAAPGLQFNSSFYDTGQIVAQPNSYVFWDDLHPTTAAHTILAQYAIEAVTYSADFNFDGEVDDFDLAEWNAAYQQNANGDADGDGDSDGLDFLEWQRQYTGGGLSPVASVPEPSSIVGIWLAVGLALSSARNRR